MYFIFRQRFAMLMHSISNIRCCNSPKTDDAHKTNSVTGTWMVQLKGGFRATQIKPGVSFL